jgi:hypothetical protein
MLKKTLLKSWIWMGATEPIRFLAEDIIALFLYFLFFGNTIILSEDSTIIRLD